MAIPSLTKSKLTLRLERAAAELARCKYFGVTPVAFNSDKSSVNFLSWSSFSILSGSSALAKCEKKPINLTFSLKVAAETFFRKTGHSFNTPPRVMPVSTSIWIRGVMPVRSPAAITFSSSERDEIPKSISWRSALSKSSVSGVNQEMIGNCNP
ncbi:unannotated protein [freshwater metagenome]|uniref:Unannotated protein n=1 Tax=freshwater metagenome TaxID=449393 RepID=A0A6J6MNF2_9ZZZZ